MTELFSEKRWSGEFFPPDAYEKRFCGEIQYSPEEGITLSYTMVGHKFPAETEVLHGVLSSGKKCTLIGRFFLYDGSAISLDGPCAYTGKALFPYLAIGDFLARDERFAKINFSLTNLQEFFYPRHSIVTASRLAGGCLRFV